MRKLGLVGLVVIAACGGGQALSAGMIPGASGPREALESFLQTVRSKDIQQMSLVWGTAEGPVRGRMERNEMEKRELLLQCYLRHDAFRVIDETKSTTGKVMFRVELAQGAVKRATNFTTVKGPEDRWFLEDVDISVMQDFCRNR